MARPTFDSVDDYLASLPAASQKVLRSVRRTIRKAIPDAEETISYQIPTYKVGGRAAIFFAAFKEHFSLYPVGESVARAFGDEVRRRVAGKGTIRFPFAEPVPLELIERIAKLRAEETRMAPTKPAAKRGAPSTAKRPAKQPAKKRR